MRPHRIVVTSPAFDQHLRLMQRRELLTRQQLVAQLGVEALTVTVLPRAARLDEECLDVDPAEPLAHVAGNELRPVVRPNVLRCPVGNEQACEAVEHVVGPELARHDCEVLRPLANRLVQQLRSPAPVWIGQRLMTDRRRNLPPASKPNALGPAYVRGLDCKPIRGEWSTPIDRRPSIESNDLVTEEFRREAEMRDLCRQRKNECYLCFVL